MTETIIITKPEHQTQQYNMNDIINYGGRSTSRYGMQKSVLLRLMQAHLRRALSNDKPEIHIQTVLTMIDDMIEDSILHKKSLLGVEAENFTAPQMPDAGPRMSTAKIDVIPNLHLDKDVLTPRELQELLAWGAETLGIGYIPESALTVIRGQPDSVANKLIDFIGTAAYGPNNYIGPGKTGNLDGVLQDIVSTVPALSMPDRLAMRHDILLTQAAELGPEAVERAHSILQSEPLMYASQNLYPLFQNDGQFNYDRLIAEGIEPNPGPRYDFTDPATVAIINSILEDPTNTSAKICNAIANDASIDEKLYVESQGAFCVKNSLNDRLDVMQMNSNWQEMSGVFCTSSTVDQVYFSSQCLNYTIRNEVVRATLTKGKLATALDQSLAEYSDFLAANRTNNPSVSGSSNLYNYTLTPNADFGMYRQMTVLILMEQFKQRLSGVANVNQISDAMIVKSAIAQPAINDYFPSSTNYTPAAPPVIEAILINSTDLGQFMKRGSWPNDFDPINALEVACVFLTGSSTPDENALLTLTHLEYPFRDIDYNVDYVLEAPNNGNPIHTNKNASLSPISNFSKIAGPKVKVLYVWLTPSQDPVTIGNVFVPYNAAAVDITAGLDFTFVNYMQNTGQSPLWQQTADILLSFMDMDDWKSAIMMALNLCRFKTPYHGLSQVSGVLANSDPVYYSSTAVPSFDISIPSIDTKTIAAANVTLLNDSVRKQPVYTPFGQPTIYWPHSNNGTGVARAPAPITNYFQESPFMTRFGVLVGYYVKERLTNKLFNKTCKVVFRQLWAAMKKLSDVLIQCSHNWYQNLGLTNLDMFPGLNANLIQNRSIGLFTSLKGHGALLQSSVAKINFDTFLTPYPYTTDLLVDTYGFHRIAWETTTIYLFNHLVNWRDPDNSLFYPKLNKHLTSLTSLGPLMTNLILTPSPVTTAFTFAGQVLTPVGQQRVMNAFGGVIGAPGPMTVDCKTVFAIAQMGHSLNPGIYSDVLRFYTYMQDNPNYVKYQNIKCFTQEFLRYDSINADSYDARKARPNFFLLLPFFPPVQDPASGRLLYPAFYSSSQFKNLKGCFSLDGTGSVDFGFTIAVIDPNAELLLPPVMGGLKV
jgi:hypothetical protein